jgi:hypothetical protein
MYAYTKGSVSFPVTASSHFIGGSFTAVVLNTANGVNLPAGIGGIDVWNIAFDSYGKGTLTLVAGSSIHKAGTYTLRLTVNGVQSPSFTFTVVEPTTKTISVGLQEGALRPGIVNYANYKVTTTGIAPGQYTPTTANFPLGVSVNGNVSIDANGVGFMNIKADATAPAGVWYDLKITIDGASGSFRLDIK